MKKILFIFALAIFVSASSFAQYSFSVSPGIAFNTAAVGYKVNSNLICFAGFQYAHFGLNTERSGREYNYDLHRVTDFSSTEEGKLTLYIPNIGAKYFLKEVNKVKTYLTLTLSKPIISGKEVENGKENKNFNDNLDNISFWGSEFGFGGEYFFDDNFSIGGEFGVRYFHYNNTDESTQNIYDPSTGSYVDVKNTREYNLNLSPTYSKISLNFYF